MGSFEDGRRNGDILPAASPSQSPAQSAARGTNVTSTAKEQMVDVMSRAREKVDHTKATATAVLSKTAHPFSSQARQEADAKAADTKAQASAKQASIRTTVQQQQTEATTPRTSIPSGKILMRSKSSCTYDRTSTCTTISFPS
jgi:septal ring-binding cell division protein DamX